ncbi:MAG: internal scaffolding protein [Microviridae sp.]|nr:MAG: internal scaffolding protein [Microviridae sp.]
MDKKSTLVKPPFVRNQFNYDTNEISDQSGLHTGSEGGAKQSFKDEVDINTIVKRFGIGYEMPEPSFLPGTQDFTNIGDFHSAMNLIARAKEQFEEFPANIRARFDNNAADWADFCLKEENRGELAKMGLLTKEAQKRYQDAQDALEAERQEATAALAEKRAKAKIPPTGGSQDPKSGS